MCELDMPGCTVIMAVLVFTCYLKKAMVNELYRSLRGNWDTAAANNGCRAEIKFDQRH